MRAEPLSCLVTERSQQRSGTGGRPDEHMLGVFWEQLEPRGWSRRELGGGGSGEGMRGPDPRLCGSPQSEGLGFCPR